jgi:IclR family transcriptional regulator, pca regulon regulatory protein
MTPHPGFPITARESGGQFVEAFARGLLVIMAFGEGHERMTLSQVAQRAGLTRAGARRLLYTLEQLGFVGHKERLFFLTPKILRLGYAYTSSSPFWGYAHPILEQLVGDVQETCTLAVLDGTEVVYVMRNSVRAVVTGGSVVGTRLPAYVTSMGRVLLGALGERELDDHFERVSLRKYTERTVTDPKELRRLIAAEHEQGWSWVQGELEEHICGLSVPVADHEGRVCAALNISVNSLRMTKDLALHTMLPKLMIAAEQLHRGLELRAG